MWSPIVRKQDLVSQKKRSKKDLVSHLNPVQVEYIGVAPSPLSHFPDIDDTVKLIQKKVDKGRQGMSPSLSLLKIVLQFQPKLNQNGRSAPLTPLFILQWLRYKISVYYVTVQVQVQVTTDNN